MPNLRRSPAPPHPFGGGTNGRPGASRERRRIQSVCLSLCVWWKFEHEVGAVLGLTRGSQASQFVLSGGRTVLISVAVRPARGGEVNTGPGSPQTRQHEQCTFGDMGVLIGLLGHEGGGREPTQPNVSVELALLGSLLRAARPGPQPRLILSLSHCCGQQQPAPVRRFFRPGCVLPRSLSCSWGGCQKTATYTRVIRQ